MIKTEFPYVDESGTEYQDLIKTWSDDETKALLQVETGFVYDEAIDLYPCRYTYEEVDKPSKAEDSEDGEEREEPERP